MTDLEQHVNEPGRDKLVKEVKAKIDALGVTYVYYQFVSVTGRIVGKGIPARHWEKPWWYLTSPVCFLLRPRSPANSLKRFSALLPIILMRTFSLPL